ncbi:helix-turn-helix domain-containing protein [Paenibacillus methanolicus]|uniref:helix-turn-helix domain-containing protein n=1 Tax=Paenibacillus methanolicus TaxID=582686 RepID=UPI0011E6299F|nr:AraC family transcriptional regulator [Paenibacillus methanolicus]
MVPRVLDRFPEIEEVVAFIHDHIDEPLPLERLARVAAYSPYHFTRIFKERVGLPPLYYVSSHRLSRAKELLLTTKLSIRDIGLEIGQQSLGTFTSRFTERVGMTPAQFRTCGEEADGSLRHLRKLGDWRVPGTPPNGRQQVEGRIAADTPFEGVVLIGLFAKPIPEGLPIFGTIIPALGGFRITDVKPGVYYLMATAVAWEMGAKEALLPRATLRSRTRIPIIVESGSEVPYQEVTLYDPRLDDPPILISLPLLMQRFLSSMARHSR